MSGSPEESPAAANIQPVSPVGGEPEPFGSAGQPGDPKRRGGARRAEGGPGRIRALRACLVSRERLDRAIAMAA